MNTLKGKVDKGKVVTELHKEKLETGTEMESWPHIPAVPAMGRQRVGERGEGEGDPEFKASLGYTVKNTVNKKRNLRYGTEEY